MNATTPIWILSEFDGTLPVDQLLPVPQAEEVPPVQLSVAAPALCEAEPIANNMKEIKNSNRAFTG